jgi:hypothetical protein
MAKIRNGFVSNSSSSSFIINAEKYSKEQILKYIEATIEAQKIVEDDEEYWGRSIDEMLDMHEEENCDRFVESALEYHNMFHERTFKELAEQKKWYKDQFPGKVIVVDSQSDNSIPWVVQEALEYIGRREHWG